MASRDDWNLAAQLLDRSDKTNDRFRMKEFISEALQQISRSDNYKPLAGLILFLPVALRLFEDGHKDKFVVSCRRALDSVEGAKATYRKYISRVFDMPVIEDAFVSQYQLLNRNAIELLEAALDE